MTGSGGSPRKSNSSAGLIATSIYPTSFRCGCSGLRLSLYITEFPLWLTRPMQATSFSQRPNVRLTEQLNLIKIDLVNFYTTLRRPPNPYEGLRHSRKAASDA